MKFLRVIEEFQRHRWAMTRESLETIRDFLYGAHDLGPEDYELFHSLSNDQRFEIADSLGDVIDGTSYTSIEGNTGFLRVFGPIIPRATWFSDMSGMVSIDTLTNEFKALENNPRIDNIVGLFDSPGGSVIGISDLAATIRASKKNTMSFNWFAASGGYWLSSAFGKVVAPDTGMVGSIGAVLTVVDTRNADQKRGVEYVDIVSSQSPNKRPDIQSAEGKAVYQQEVNELADVFIETVARNRGVSVQDVLDKFGAGAMIVAKRAESVGMIDQIQDLDSFMESFESSKNATLPGFQISARAEQHQEVTMGDQNQTVTMTAEQLKSEQPAAVAEIVAAAKTEERERLQAIEGLAAKFDNSLPSIREAAINHINSAKFDANATPESIALGLVDVTAGAKVEAVESIAKPRREAAEAASQISNANQAPSDERGQAEASQARVNGLAEAMKRLSGGK